MTPTEHPAKIRSAKTGLLATLRALLRTRGTGARSPRLALLVLTASACLAFLAPAFASAAFTRQFVRQITGTCETPGESPIGPSACPHSKFLPFGSVGGVAVDEKDDLWVGDLSSGDLDEFSPAYLAGEPNGFLQTLPIKAEGPPEDRGDRAREHR